MYKVDKQRLIQMNILGGIIGTSNDLTQEAYKNLGYVSKWLLGGALGFSFVILTSPQEMMNIYGIYPTKFSLISFLASAVLGFKFILSNHVYQALSESRSFNQAAQYQLSLDESLEPEVMGKNGHEYDLVNEVDSAIEKSLNSVSRLLRKSKTFCLQTLFLSFPLMNFLYQFFF